MKICAYVQEQYAKANYKKECMETRQFVGLRVIIDCLQHAGYTVDYAGIATVHQYDIILVSLTSDCDWWPFISERMRWRKGNYKILVGGAGVLHIEPFLPFCDYFMFGRGEDLIIPLIKGIDADGGYENENIACSDTFSADKIYKMAQAVKPYPYRLKLSAKREFQEGPIGCNHKCLFCGYTWHRKFLSQDKYYHMEDSLFGNIADKERAMLDLHEDPKSIDFAHLRTTAIDGMSERIRCAVGKRITKDIMLEFLDAMLRYEGKPGQIKFYNIVGYPSENDDDWAEFLETLKEADARNTKREKQWSIVLHSTPFRPMPCTPMACAPASKKNYRGLMGRVLGAGLKGNIIYQGKSLWCVESMGTDSLATHMLSMLAHRGRIDDSENIAKMCANKKFWRASSATKEATLEKYFDMDHIFGPFEPDTLPSRYLMTYAKVERMWGKTPLETEYKRMMGT